MLEKFLKTRRRMYERIKKRKTLNGNLFYRIATIYFEGLKIEKNIDAAIKYYEKAAALGDYDSIWELAQIYYYGDEVPQDLLKAEEYFIKGDCLDCDCANEMEMSITFAEMYHYGKYGVKKNMAKAVYWYELIVRWGAVQDYEDFVITLAKIYRDGDGVPQNGKRAVALLSGTAFEDYYYGLEYEYPATFMEGSDKARYMLACMYLYGQGVKKNIHKAEQWFNLVDELDLYDEGEIFKLAEAYRKGDGVKQDIENAIAWYNWLREYEGDFSGKIACTLGEIYYRGDGVKKNINTAVEYFEEAAENGNEKAVARLWKIELYGEN